MFLTGNGSFIVPFRVSKTLKTISMLQLSKRDLMRMGIMMGMIKNGQKKKPSTTKTESTNKRWSVLILANKL